MFLPLPGVQLKIGVIMLICLWFKSDGPFLCCHPCEAKFTGLCFIFEVIRFSVHVGTVSDGCGVRVCVCVCAGDSSSPQTLKVGTTSDKGKSTRSCKCCTWMPSATL